MGTQTQVVGRLASLFLALTACLSPASAGAATTAASPAIATPTPDSPAIHRLGTNEMVGGRALGFRAPLSAYARAQVPYLRTNVTLVSAALVLPEDWVGRPWIPVFVVCSPSGSLAIPQIAGYTNAALAEGWAVLAADGPRLPPDRDTVMWNWGAIESALDYLHKALPESRAWPLAIGGFSGGAKRAAYVAAAALAAHRDVRGVFMGGCNEDRVSMASLLYPAGPRFLATPLFLSNGEQDPIAGAEYGAALKASMERHGFTRIRLATYPDRHRLFPRHVQEALRWFRNPNSPSR